MPNTILLKGRGIRKEAISAAAITPGYLVDINSSGQVLKHAGAGLAASPSFAVEDELNGKEISVDWASGDQVIYETLPAGAEVNALVAASAAAIVIGDELESAGDGTLRLITVGDVVDLTDSSTGTASDTIAAIGATYDQDEVRNAVASLTAKVNALLPGALNNIVARAIEAVDNSGGGVEARIKVEIV